MELKNTTGPTPRPLQNHQTSELSLVTIYEEPNLVINDRRAKNILSASAMLTAAGGFAAMITAGIVLDSVTDLGKTFGGWNIRLGYLVFTLGFAVLVGGFAVTYHVQEGNMSVVYRFVGMMSLCLAVFFGLALVKLLADVNQEAEDRTREGFGKLNDTIFRKSILKFQFNQFCCGVYGPNFYDNWPEIPTSCCGEKSYEMTSNSVLRVGSWICTAQTAFKTGCVEVVKAKLKRAYRATAMGLLSVVTIDALILLVDYVVMTRGEWLFSQVCRQN